MFKRQFHLTIRRRRQALGLSQRELAARSGLHCSKVALFELGQRVPKPDELRSLAEGLVLAMEELFECSFRPARYEETIRDNGRRRVPKLEPFYPHQERPNSVRFRAALRKYPEVVRPLVARIRKRKDFAYLNFFCERLACGSAEECVYLLGLLALGGDPGVVEPNRYGRLPLPIVDPATRKCIEHQPFPCILEQTRVHFLQVSFLVGQVHTVDFLRWESGWSIVEVDGRGHDGTFDRERDQALDVSVERLSTEMLLAWARGVVGPRG